MERWNGWGNAEITMDLPTAGQKMLVQNLGPGKPRPDYPRSKLLKKIPKSRLPRHPLGFITLIWKADIDDLSSKGYETK